MDKRQFLKSSSAMVTGALLSRLAPGFAESPEAAPDGTNWAGNLHYHARCLYTPGSLREVQDTVKQSGSLRALGSRHSFNAIADSLAAQISLERLASIEVDAAAHTVTVGAGVRYGTLAPVIDAKGYAVHNLASLPHITVAGAVATATHGSGIRNGNLATAVSALELVKADGEVVTLSRQRDGAVFEGSVVALGALGVVTQVTLNLVRRFDMTQIVYRNLSMAQLRHNLDAILGSGYSVSLFTNWQHHNINQVWIKSRVESKAKVAIPPEFFGAKAATENLHPIDGHSAENCTQQMGVPGPWYERLPHFRMNFTPSSGAELQTEYFVPRNRGYEAILAVEQLRDKITPHLFVTEIRTIAADELWLSPAYKRDSMAIHFTWKPETPEVTAILPLIEEKLAAFDARPHWAKLFTIPPARLNSLYEKMPAYRALLKQYDPAGKFRNGFIDHNIFG